MSKSKYVSQAKEFFDFIETKKPRNKQLLKPIRAASECNHRMISKSLVKYKDQIFDSSSEAPSSCPSASGFDDNSMTLYMTENDVLNDQFICVKCRRKFLLCNYYLHKASCYDDVF